MLSEMITAVNQLQAFNCVISQIIRDEIISIHMAHESKEHITGKMRMYFEKKGNHNVSSWVGYK